MKLGLDRPELRAWALYDWANSAFVTSVVTAIFPVYFAMIAAAGGLSPGQATMRFSLATTGALGATALLSPLLGTLSDRRPIKKRMLALFMVCGVGATAAMVTILPGAWAYALALFVLANIGATGSLVFYDALLPHIASSDEIDRVSTAGYALGYLGGGLLLAVHLALIAFPEQFGLSDVTAAVRVCFASVALWWLAFSVPLLRRIPEPPVVQRPQRPLREVVRDLKRYRQALLFLLAFLFYNDGIGTIIRLATAYGTELGISSNALVGAILLVQGIGIPATFAFGQLGSWIGTKRALFVALAVYSGISLLGYFMTSATTFYVLAALVGLVQGGSQALSRSLFATLIPKHCSGEFFGVFSVFEKSAAIFGPAFFSLALLVTGSSRSAIVSILGFFIVGGMLLARVDVAAGRREALQS